MRGTSVFAVAVTFGYLFWRVTSDTVDPGVWWVSVPLIVAELHNGVGLALFTVALWDVDGGPRRPPLRYDQRHLAGQLRVAVLIPTYNEHRSVLLPTIAAAIALQPAHETWVLDDGRRDDVHELARALGARYVTRPDNTHYKAGNLNHALALVDADIIAVLDADHVPLPDFLRHTIGYFEDPQVAVVQTPQDFYNLDSFEHEDNGDEPFSEEAIFYRVIAPAKNRWGGAFWCGSSALLRVAALRLIGGVATDSVTEDIATTIRLNERGWRVLYHNEVLARGLAPTTADGYWAQRHRWALGAMQVIRRHNPLFVRGLTIGQRLSFATTLLGWFDPWRTLLFLLVPPLALVTGASPIRAESHVFGPLFLLTFASQFAALRLLGRGRYLPLRSLLFEVLRLPAVLPATLALVTGGSDVFRVTSKGSRVTRSQGASVAGLLQALIAASLVAEFWFVLTYLGWTPTVYVDGAAAWWGFSFNTANLSLLIWAARRVRAPRFSGERRQSVRFAVQSPGLLDGIKCLVRDLSATGALIEVDSAALASGVDRPHQLEIELADGPARISCRVRRSGPSIRGRRLVGVEFAEHEVSTAARIARALMWSGASYGAVGERLAA